MKIYFYLKTQFETWLQLFCLVSWKNQLWQRQWCNGTHHMCSRSCAVCVFVLHVLCWMTTSLWVETVSPCWVCVCSWRALFCMVCMSGGPRESCGQNDPVIAACWITVLEWRSIYELVNTDFFFWHWSLFIPVSVTTEDVFWHHSVMTVVSLQTMI